MKFPYPLGKAITLQQLNPCLSSLKATILPWRLTRPIFPMDSTSLAEHIPASLSPVHQNRPCSRVKKNSKARRMRTTGIWSSRFAFQPNRVSVSPFTDQLSFRSEEHTSELQS